MLSRDYFEHFSLVSNRVSKKQPIHDVLLSKIDFNTYYPFTDQAGLKLPFFVN